MIRSCQSLPYFARFIVRRPATCFSTSSGLELAMIGQRFYSICMCLAQYPRSFLSHVKNQKFSGYGIGMACLTLSLATQVVQLRMQLNEANETIQKMTGTCVDTTQLSTSESEEDLNERTFMDGSLSPHDSPKQVRSDSDAESKETTPLTNRKKVVLS